MIGRALAVWLVIAVAEVLHGILRVALLNRRVGDRRARQIGVFSGSALILLIAWLTAPWLRMSQTAGSLLLPSQELAMMHDMAYGRDVTLLTTA